VATSRRYGIIGLALGLSTYAAFIGNGLRGSVAQLAFAKTPATPAFVEAAEEAAPPVARPETEPSADGARVGPTPGSSVAATTSAAGAPAEQSAAALDESTGGPSEDSTTLRRRALEELSARPDFAELLNAPSTEVQRALLDFFEDR
jgi:hypothetical protein